MGMVNAMAYRQWEIARNQAGAEIKFRLGDSSIKLGICSAETTNCSKGGRVAGQAGSRNKNLYPSNTSIHSRCSSSKMEITETILSCRTCGGWNTKQAKQRKPSDTNQPEGKGRQSGTILREKAI
jgi:hypothetical protein